MVMKHSVVRHVLKAAVGTSARGGGVSLHSSASGGALAAGAPRQACSLRSNAHRTGTLTASLAPAAATNGVASCRYLSSTSGMDGNDGRTSASTSSGRFSDDLEKLISRAGEQADRSAKGRGDGTSDVSGDAGGEAAAAEGEKGEGGEVALDSKISARAMKFRAMISKLRPQKKVVVVQTFTPSREPLVDNLGRSYGLGRRKTSTARVWISLSAGEGGVFTVNSRPMIDFFPRDHLQNEILKPLEFTRKLGFFHVRCTTKGGGQAGQAGAIRLGLARALEAHDPWLRKFLKKEGLMERDSRKVERKKPGLKKARKAPQWVKR